MHALASLLLAGSATALAVLLVTTQLTGGVHAHAACAADGIGATFYAALNRYSEPEQMLTDPDLASLQGDPQLHELVDQMSAQLKPSHSGGAQP